MLNSTTLIESVKRRASIPTAQATFEESDFLAFANEEMSMGMLPAILQYHEEFLVYQEEAPIEANVSSYSIPDRAVGNKLRAIFFKDTSGTLHEMARISPDDLAIYANPSGINIYKSYYVQNNSIVLVPEVKTNVYGSLVMFYYMRPNELVSSSRIATVTAKTATTLTVNTIPTIFTIATPLDMLEASGGLRTLTKDVTPTAVNYGTKVLTFASGEIPDSLAIGDNVALAGECYVPQIPNDLHSILAQRVAARCTEAMGDAAGLQAANAKIVEMELKMGNLIDNRSESDPQKITNFNGLLRNGRRQRWR